MIRASHAEASAAAAGTGELGSYLLRCLFLLTHPVHRSEWCRDTECAEARKPDVLSCQKHCEDCQQSASGKCDGGRHR